jgi:hypothetical protein
VTGTLNEQVRQAGALPRVLAELSFTAAHVARLDEDVAAVAARFGLPVELSRGHDGAVRSAYGIVGEYEYVFAEDAEDPSATTVWSRPGRSAGTRPVSIEEYWSRFRKRPGMYMGAFDYGKLRAYLSAFDQGTGGRFLDGLYVWLLNRLDVPWTRLGWQGLAEIAVFGRGATPPRPWPKETDDAAVEALFELLDEFFAWRHGEQVAAAARDLGLD